MENSKIDYSKVSWSEYEKITDVAEGSTNASDVFKHPEKNKEFISKFGFKEDWESLKDINGIINKVDEGTKEMFGHQRDNIQDSIQQKAFEIKKAIEKEKDITPERVLSRAIFKNDSSRVNALIDHGVKPNKSHLQLMKEMKEIKPEIERTIKDNMPQQNKGMRF